MFGMSFSDYLEGPWDQAKGYLREHLEQLDSFLRNQWSQVFNQDGTLNEVAVGNPGAGVPSYVANTGTNRSPRWEKIDLANGVKSDLKFSNLTPASVPSVLLGRESGSAGDFEEISLGPGLVMTGTVLDSTSSVASGTDYTHIFMFMGS